LRNIEKEDEFGTSDEEDEEDEEKLETEKPASEPLIPVKTESGMEESGTNLKRTLELNDAGVKRIKTEATATKDGKINKYISANLFSG
jgi:hypothetical protein